MDNAGKPPALTRTGLAGTLKEQAAQLIKEAIYRGELFPGRIFSHEQLSRQLGISRTPIREALLELQGDGLVIIHRGRGTEVVPLSRREVQEIFEMREALEIKAFTLAIERIPEQELSELQLFFQHHLQQVCSGGHVDIAQANRRFHLMVARASSNRRLYKAIASLLEQPARTGFYALFQLQRVNESMAEHRALLGALVEKDPVKARDVVSKHLRRTCEAVLRSLEKAGAAP